jgi:hypothetical protein
LIEAHFGVLNRLTVANTDDTEQLSVGATATATCATVT